MIAAAVILLLSLLFFVFLIWHGQERILFQPPGVWAPDDTAAPVAYQAADGQKLAGYIIGAAPASHVLLCFHGNADLAVRQIEWARRVASITGYVVFLAEYRGYMSLGGTPTYATTRLDAMAAYDYIRSVLQTQKERIAYFGHSLGSGVAAELAQSRPASALILQSPFTSARAMARLMVSPPVEILWSKVSRIHFDTQRRVSELMTPVSVAHGKRDRIVPFRMGLQVYEAARMKGELLIVEKAGHSDLPSVGGDDYWKWITASLAHARHSVT